LILIISRFQIENKIKNEGEYKTDGKGKIISYEGKATEVNIPAQINCKLPSIPT
jgi:hypothetical protein